ncbi:amidophosphoribosyltransferase [Nafulsella turpanensis]|uniref:amidophosphoribosyltransferase n=1 Tax=Nafulsella turpanensis TaxID=1265690 RepID=UPI0003450ECD|nr:amidophosphoribosyltransferase [Nafulsella turpanensis]
MQDVVRQFVNLLFPPLCLLCERTLVQGEKFMCTHCLASLPHSHLHEQRNEVLAQKLSAVLPVRFVLSYLLYQKSGSTQKLLQFLKYKNYPEVGRVIGRQFGGRLQEKGYGEAFDVVIPVPLHPKKQRQRGYNQSEEFAKGLSEVLEIPYTTDWVIRKEASSTQTRKSRLDRWLNVATIFDVPEQEKVKGKRILLVDDVVTTGATLEACATALLEGGCKELSVGAIAVA